MRVVGSVALLLFGLLGSGAAAAEAQDKVGGTPWHLVDYWWDFGADAPFESRDEILRLDPPEKTAEVDVGP